jgi:hypothetical protein
VAYLFLDAHAAYRGRSDLSERRHFILIANAMRMLREQDHAKNLGR